MHEPKSQLMKGMLMVVKTRGPQALKEMTSQQLKDVANGRVKKESDKVRSKRRVEYLEASSGLTG
jgi:hypothetical protein